MLIIDLNEYQTWSESTRYSYSLIVFIFNEYITSTSEYCFNLFWKNQVYFSYEI